MFLPSASHTIIVFLCQTAYQYSDGNPTNGGVDCRWGRQKSRFWAYICLLLMLQQAGVVNTVAGGPRPPYRKLLHIAGSKRRWWLRVKTTKCLWQEAKPQRYAKDNRTAHLTARSDKSVPYVTITIKDCTRRFVLLKLTTDRHEASRGLFATAELLVIQYTNVTVIASRTETNRHRMTTQAAFGCSRAET